MNLDIYLFNLITKYTGKYDWLDKLAIFFARYLAYIEFGLLFLISCAIDWRIFFVPLFFASVSRYLITEAIYLFYKRKRPFKVLKKKPLFKSPQNPAFPSGHASFFFGLSFAVLFYSIPLGAVFVAASLLICIFRVFCRMHWPSDILAGAGAAAILPAIILLLNIFL